MKAISSRDNPTFRRLRAIAHSGKERRREGSTLLDGAHLVETYLERVGEPELVAVSERGRADGEVGELLERVPPERCCVLSDALFEDVSPVDAPSGVVALIGIPRPSRPSPSGSWIVLEGIQDPGNVGSILRSAAAAGITDALLTTGCAQAWSPRVLRAGMGANFAIAIHERANALEALAAFRGTIAATVARSARAVFDADLRGRVAWLFGTEGEGLSPSLRELAGIDVSVPMPGRLESLNVAAAAAICLFEQVRQRGTPAVRARRMPED